jgi:hypothetical protein
LTYGNIGPTEGSGTNMTAALALKIEEADDLAGATKECFGCDPDNPRAVPRPKCGSCRGTGRQPLAASQIALELAEAREEGDHQDRGGDGGDLYLEY